MSLYQLYGLTVKSDIHLPECLLAVSNSEVDVRFINGLVPETGIDPASEDSWEQSIEGEFWLNVEEVARYWIRQGNEIIIEPYPDADEESIRVYLLGSAIGVGNIFANFLNGALRNPSAAASQVGNLFVGAALAEALGVLAFVLGILILNSWSLRRLQRRRPR